MTGNKKKKKKKNNKKQKGFTLVEVLVVVLLIALSAVSLASISKQMVNAHMRLRSINEINAQSQKFVQYFTKVVRMSSSYVSNPAPADLDISFQNNSAIFKDCTGQVSSISSTGINNADELHIVWRRPGAGAIDQQNFTPTLICFNKDVIKNFFTDRNIKIKDNKVTFNGGGIDDINRVTINFEAIANKGTPILEVTVPIQATVSFRTFNK